MDTFVIEGFNTIKADSYEGEYSAFVQQFSDALAPIEGRRAMLTIFSDYIEAAIVLKDGFYTRMIVNSELLEDSLFNVSEFLIEETNREHTKALAKLTLEAKA